MSDLDSIIKEFLVESSENLDQLDRDLVALEKEPGDQEKLASIFRTIHTIKGTCGFLGFVKLEAVAQHRRGFDAPAALDDRAAYADPGLFLGGAGCRQPADERQRRGNFSPGHHCFGRR